MSVIPDRRKIVNTGRAIFLEVEQAWWRNRSLEESVEEVERGEWILFDAVKYPLIAISTRNIRSVLDFVYV